MFVRLRYEGEISHTYGWLKRAHDTHWTSTFRLPGGLRPMPHNAPFTLSLSVWVPSGAARAWLPCPLLSDAATDELIQSCDELKAVFRAHGKLVARILSAPAAPRYDGFRIIGRRKDTGELVAAVEWQRSRETGELVLYPVVWTSCRYEHPETALVV